MNNSGDVTLEDVRHVAELAHLELTPVEEVGMLRDLNSILEHIAQLEEIETAELEPMAQAGELLRSSAGTPGNVLRPDEQRPSLLREDVMRSAPETDGVFFKVPKVIDR